MAIKDGVRSIYYAIMTNVETETYDTVKELGKLVEFNVETSENTTNKYAGNALYRSSKAMGEVNLSFTIPEISEEDYRKLFGYETDTTYGGTVVTNSTSRPYICLMVEETAEDIVIYHHFYKGIMGVPSIGSKTSEGQVQYNDVSFACTFMPLQTCKDSKGNNVWRFEMHSDDPKYTSSQFKTKWGKEVIKPFATSV